MREEQGMTKAKAKAAKANKVTEDAKSPKYALITGASSGMGKLFSTHAASDGYNIIALGMETEEKALETLKQNLKEQFGVKTYVLLKDLSKKGAVKEIEAFVKDHNLTVDMLINNAGFGYDAPFIKSDKKRQNMLEAVDVKVVRQLCRAFLPAMVKRHDGKVLNIASAAAFMPGPYMATYFASKAYVYSLSMALHYELEETGVSVTTLCPGPVKTPFWDAADAGDSLYVKMALPPEKVARIAYNGLKKNKALVLPGFLSKFFPFAGRIFPRALMAYAAMGLNLSKI